MSARLARPVLAHGRRWARWGVVLSALVLAACSSPVRQASSPQQPPQPAQTSQQARQADQGKRNDLALFALSLLDTPYAWGGKGPATGFDCSGLVSHVYREATGLRVRGSAADLGQQAKPIDTAALQPGDLVFFNTLGQRHSHVGIYVGNGRFVHASNPRTGVRMDKLGSRYYAQRFEGAASLLD